MKVVSNAVTRLTGVSIVALALAGTAAFAQDAAGGPGTEAAPAGGLEEIVVTARKVAENLQDVPIAITVLSGEELRTRSVREFSDLANFTPGFSARASNSGLTSIALTIRGQVQEDTLATLDPSVGTYVDGINWARAYGLNSGLLDVSSAQVLKGPQGTLFGRNTTGGALVITTNDPVIGDLSGRLSLSYGRFDEREAIGVVNVPLGEKVAVRLAGQVYKRDGYLRNVVGPNATTQFGPAVAFFFKKRYVGSLNGAKFEDRDRINLRGKVLLKPADNVDLLFSAEYFDADDSGPARQFTGAFPAFTFVPGSVYNVSSTAALFAGLVSGGPAPTTPANAATTTALGLATLNTLAAARTPGVYTSNELANSFVRTQTYNFIGSIDTDWGQVKLLTNYRHIAAATQTDNDGSPFAIHSSGFRQRLKQMSGELQFTGNAFNDAVKFAAGAFVFHESGFDQSLSITVPALNPNSGHNHGVIDNDSVGIYSQATWQFTDQFSFTGGLRYSVDDKGADVRPNNYNRTTGLTTCNLVPGASFNFGFEVVGPTQCSRRRRDSFGGWSYTAGFEWKPNNDTLLYVKTAKGFRSGGQNLRAATPAAFIPFQPETAYSYEVGAKVELLDRRLRVNLSAYTTTVKNIQKSTVVPLATAPFITTVIGNAGKAQFRGGEIEIQALLFEGFRVSASGALVDPKYKQFADALNDRSNERFRFVAKRQFTVAADYETALTGDIGAKLHIDYAWRSKMATDPYFFAANPSNQAIIDATTAPALGLLGARATLLFGDTYELAVYGRNLTNERPNVNDQLIAGLGYVAGQRQEPLTYGVTGTFKF